MSGSAVTLSHASDMTVSYTERTLVSHWTHAKDIQAPSSYRHLTVLLHELCKYGSV